MSASLFLVLALILATTLGPQTRPWSWGPAMLALGAALVAALPMLWRSKRMQADFGRTLACWRCAS